MTRSTKTIVSVAGIVLGAMIASLVTYYIGESFGQSIVAGATEKLKLNVWTDAYKGLVNVMTVLMMLIAFIYYVMLRFVSKVSSPNDGGKRGFWGIFLCLTIVVSLVFPFIFAAINDDFVNSIKISVLFTFVYGIVYFWLGSIFVTPDAYKYSPIGATAVRK